MLDDQGTAESQAIAVPVKALKAGDSNRVGFAMEGRGTFGYAVTLTGFTREFGPDQDQANRPARVDRRVYWPAPPELDGKVLPVGLRRRRQSHHVREHRDQVRLWAARPAWVSPSGATFPGTRPNGSAIS